MSLRTALVALFVWVHTSSSLGPQTSSAKKSGCFKVNNCKCIMKDGSGVINLKAVGDAQGFLGRLRPVSGPGAEALLSLSPCQPFSQPEDRPAAACTNVAACLLVRLNGLSSRYLSFGRHEDNEFHYNDSVKTLSVSYKDHEEHPLTVVHFHCNPNESSSSISRLRLVPEEPLQVWVETPCACLNACAMGDLGLGTIFLIILCLSAAAYFILGSCALRPFRSSSGVQISPEQSVWCMVCSFCTESSRRDDAAQTH